MAENIILKKPHPLTRYQKLTTCGNHMNMNSTHRNRDRYRCRLTTYLSPFPFESYPPGIYIIYILYIISEIRHFMLSALHAVISFSHG